MSKDSNYVEIPPNAARTLAALRELGYDSVSAVCDLIDNSIDAGAKNMSLTVKQIGKSHVIEIADDGCGMSKDGLKEALRLGSDVEKDVRSDLGKYGMGLVTASLSIAKTILVMSRRSGEQAWEAKFDVPTVERHGQFVIELKPASTKHVWDSIGDFGTTVQLTNVDRLDDTNVTRFSATLRERIGQTFRYFLKDGLNISVNRKKVVPIDPLMREHELTEIRHDGDVDLGWGKQAHLTVVELPDLGPAEDEANNITPQRSGFYIVRNRREIMGAQTFGFYKHHHSYSHFRAELSFTGELDHDFHVDVKKSSILPNDQMLDKIQHATRRFIEQSGREGRERAISKTQLTHDLSRSLLLPRPTTAKLANDGPILPQLPIDFQESDHGTSDKLFKITKADGRTVLDYNKRHPLVQLVANARLQKGIAILDCLCYAMAKVAETPQGQALVDRLNEALRTVLTAGTSEDTWENRDRAARKIAQ